MRWCVLFAFAVDAFGQAADDQRPRYLPGWPCTGKERSFDPVYAHTAEATGGQLFLFDKSEVSGFSKFAIGDMKHKQTVVRAAGKLDSYTDIRIPVDQSIASLFVTVTLQCMQTVLIYDPMSVGVHPDEMGGEDNWFRAGRIAIPVAHQEATGGLGQNPPPILRRLIMRLHGASLRRGRPRDGAINQRR